MHYKKYARKCRLEDVSVALVSRPQRETYLARP